MASSEDTDERLKAALADRYRIERELGRGGMATVYLAEDLKHHRKVAVKVLNPDLAEALGAERFLREIEVAANLSHPHILSLHDSGEADRLLFYVMPFIEGESLRARLEREKQLPVDDAIRIAREIADALAYAHDRGVIHRDVKPANIMLEAGHAVLADFGVAQAVASVEQTKLTQTGTSLGTPAYLSPEQASGEASVDGRSDEYALACVVYEMLVGEPPHTGSTVQAIIAKVLSTEPRPISEVRSSVPPNVVASVRKALEKVPADRFAGTREFSQALADPSFALPPAGSPPTRAAAGDRWRRRALLATGVAAVLAIIAGVAVRANLGGDGNDRPSSLTLRLPTEIAGFHGWDGVEAVLTPDCGALVFASDNTVFVRPLDDPESTSIATFQLNGTPTLISPDGRQVGFIEGGSLRATSLDGTQDIVIHEDLGPNPGWFGGAWGSDGYIYFTPDATSGIHRIAARGGEPEVVTMLDPTRGEVSHRFPSLLPGGRGLLFTLWYGRVDSAQVALRNLETGVIQPLATGMSPKYAPSGHLVFGRADGSIQAVRFDLETLQAIGSPITVETGAFISSYGDVRFSFCEGGVFAYQTGAATQQLFVQSRDGQQLLVEEGYDYTGPVFSRDGSRLAVSRKAEDRVGIGIWVFDLGGGTVRPVTTEGPDYGKSWSPDGEHLAFYSNREGSFSLYQKRADGTGPTELLLASEHHQFSPDYSPDGRWLVYHQGLIGGGRDRDLWLLPLDGGDPELLVGTPDQEVYPSFSPDGRYVSYSSEGQVWVVEVQNPENRIQVSVDGAGGGGAWANDGTRLFYSKPGQGTLVAVPVQTTPTFAVLGPEKVLFDRTGSISPDGSRIAFTRREKWARLEIVTNWFDELIEKVGR